MNRDVKKRFVIDVDRSNQKSKLEGLMLSQKDMVTDLKYLYSLIEDDNFIIFSILARNMNVWKAMLFIICLTQNLLILAILENEHEFSMEIIYLREMDKLADTDKQNIPLLLLITECI